MAYFTTQGPLCMNIGCMSPTALMEHIEMYVQEECLFHIGFKHFILEMYNDYNGVGKKHYATVNRRTCKEEYTESLCIHGCNHARTCFQATEIRNASALKNVQTVSSNGKRLCGAESTILIKNQYSHKVNVVNDCSDKKKTRLTVITKGPVSVTTRGKSSKCDLVVPQESTEILTSSSIDESLNRIVAKGVVVPNIHHGKKKWIVDENKRTWYNGDERRRFFLNSPSTPEDPVAQRERFFKTVPSSSCNKDRRTDHEVGNTNQEVKNEDVTDRKRRTEQDGGEFN